MKNILILSLAVFFGNNLYAGSFSLDSVKSLICADLVPTAEIDVYFTTESEPAHQYHRRSGQLPYEYRNKVSPYMGFSSGVMKLKNNPDHANGQIVLTDDWNGENAVVLTLNPTEAVGQYEGILTGDIETSAGWGSPKEHALSCVMKLN